MPPLCVRVLLGIAVPLLLPACGTGSYFIAKNEPWRADEEQACLSSGVVQRTAWVRTRTGLGGPSACGAEQPFEMSAANGGRVLLKPPALLRCPMIPQVDRWVGTVIEPAARKIYGASLAEITVGASYSCRPVNNVSGGMLSEHGHANALDVSAFTLTDGTRIAVKSGWNGDARQQAFLRAVHDGACAQFTTVLGPNYDANHSNHFHVDLARRGANGLGNICR
jgi:hypothetical protein